MPITWDPAHKDTLQTLSGGNLVATSSAGSGTVNSAVYATTAVSATIRQYWEVTVSGTIGQYFAVGVINGSAALNANIGSTNGAGLVNKYGGAGATRSLRNGVVGTSFVPPDFNQTAPVVIQIAIDRANNKMWWKINNVTWGPSSDTWFGDASTGVNPATGAGGLLISAVTGTIYPAVSSAWTSDVATINAAAPFAYAIPAGFVALDPTSATAQARAFVLA